MDGGLLLQGLGYGMGEAGTEAGVVGEGLEFGVLEGGEEVDAENDAVNELFAALCVRMEHEIGLVIAAVDKANKFILTNEE